MLNAVDWLLIIIILSVNNKIKAYLRLFFFFYIIKTSIDLSEKPMKHKKLNEKIISNEKSFQFKEAIIYNFYTKVFVDSFS
jgi:hypothetical protein